MTADTRRWSHEDLAPGDVCCHTILVGPVSGIMGISVSASHAIPVIATLLL